MSKDSFSGVEETVILESKYSGATNVLTPVPVIDRIEEGEQYVGSCRPEQAGVGGHGGHQFNPVVTEELQINFGGNVNGLIINNRPYGGTLGTKSKLLELADGEYIDRVEVRYDRYLDWVLFRTNRGQVIKGGTMYETSKRLTLNNVRVLLIGGRAEAFMDWMELTYCTDYKS